MLPLISKSQPDPGIVQLNMHDEAGKNCLSPEFVEALTEHIAALSEVEDLKVVVLTGLPDIFCGGADLSTLQRLGTQRMEPIDIQLTKTLLDIPVPVIAAMEGHAVGGGLALGLCADMVLLAEESRYGCSFMNMGFTPGMGITRLLEHFMSAAVAHEFQYSGTHFKGRDLRGKTQFNYILPRQEVLPKALELAQSIAEKPSKSLRLLKRYLSMPRRKTFEETISIESMMHELTFHQPDTLTSIQENYVR